MKDGISLMFPNSGLDFFSRIDLLNLVFNFNDNHRVSLSFYLFVCLPNFKESFSQFGCEPEISFIMLCAESYAEEGPTRSLPKVVSSGSNFLVLLTFSA